MPERKRKPSAAARRVYEALVSRTVLTGGMSWPWWNYGPGSENEILAAIDKALRPPEKKRAKR